MCVGVGVCVCVCVCATTAQRINWCLLKEQQHETKRLLTSLTTMHTHDYIFLCTQYPIHNSHTCIHTTPLCIHTHMHTHPYAYTPIRIHTHMHTHNFPMHSYTQFAYLCIHPTTICIHTHMHTHLFQTYRVTNSYMLCHASCSMLAITVIVYSVTPFFLIFVPWS